MYVKDTVLYKACYCGLCKSIGNVCGQRGRFALNYDLTFLSIFTLYLFLFITAQYLGVIGVIFAPAIAATVCVLVQELYIKNIS